MLKAAVLSSGVRACGRAVPASTTTEIAARTVLVLSKIGAATETVPRLIWRSLTAIRVRRISASKRRRCAGSVIV